MESIKKTFYKEKALNSAKENIQCMYIVKENNKYRFNTIEINIKNRYESLRIMELISKTPNFLHFVHSKEGQDFLNNNNARSEIMLIDLIDFLTKNYNL